MDRFDAMQAFARVVDTGSFTKAAASLHISRTTVTQLIQQLEARLRVRLLNRTTRRVNVTADGAAYYARVVRLLAELDDAETSLPSATAAPHGRLRVDVPSPFARLILIPALPDFHTRYPDIQLDLGVSDRTIDLIDESVDCVIRGGQITELSLVARQIGDLQAGIYAAPGYLARMGLPTHPDALENSQHRIVGYRRARSGGVLPYHLQREGESITVHGRHVLSVDDGNAYVAAGVAGLGVLWLPEYMAAAHVGSGELLRLFADWQLPPMPLHIAFPPNRHLSVALRAFIDWVAQITAQHAPVVRPPPR